jgi:phage RecT family recombinase
MKNELSVYDKATASATLLLKDPSVAGRFSKLKTAPLQWAAEKSYALQQILKNEYLAATVVSNPLSLCNALTDVAMLGVSLSPTLGHAYLIPEKIAEKATVTVMVSYKGLEHLVLKSKAVRSINTELVYSNDTFERGTRDGVPYADFVMARGERGTLEGGFCLSKLKNGERNVEWMSAEELEGCHAAATKKQKKDPFTWQGAFKGEMQKKCIVRRAAKHWVLPTQLVDTLTRMDAAEPMDFSAPDTAPDTAPRLTPEHAEAIHEALRDEHYGDGQITVWMERQVQAWGHKGLESFPDDAWERLRDALIERKAKVAAMMTTTGPVSPSATPQAAHGSH